MRCSNIKLEFVLGNYYFFFLCRVDGGVSRNDFVLQLLSNLTGLVTERPQTTEMTSMGAAYLAGLVSGKDILLHFLFNYPIIIHSSECKIRG